MASSSKSTMKAVRYHGPNIPLTLELVDVPSSLGKDHVLVQIHAAALCHTELHFCDGTLDMGVRPMTLGHEAAGIITQVGCSVDISRIGQRVVCYYYVGCQKCRWCKEGDEQLCGNMTAQHGFLSDGGLAEYIQTPARNAVPFPDHLSFVDAAPIGCAVTTAVHAAKLAEVRAGDWTMIYGVNGVGFALVQLLKNHYQAKVICVTRSQSKRDKALELGADVAIIAKGDTDNGSAVRDATGGEGADVIFECVGRRETMDACVGWTGALGKRGRLVMIGYHAGVEHEFRCHPMSMIVYEQKVIGSVGATLADLKEAVKLVGSGKVKTVVDSTLPLKDFQLGLDKIKDCTCVGKIVCLPCDF